MSQSVRQSDSDRLTLLSVGDRSCQSADCVSMIWARPARSRTGAIGHERARSRSRSLELGPGHGHGHGIHLPRSRKVAQYEHRHWHCESQCIIVWIIITVIHAFVPNVHASCQDLGGIYCNPWKSGSGINASANCSDMVASHIEFRSNVSGEPWVPERNISYFCQETCGECAPNTSDLAQPTANAISSNHFSRCRDGDFVHKYTVGIHVKRAFKIINNGNRDNEGAKPAGAGEFGTTIEPRPCVALGLARSQILCGNGEIRRDWKCGAARGGRVGCPPNLPFRCAKQHDCGGGMDQCCERDCASSDAYHFMIPYAPLFMFIVFVSFNIFRIKNLKL